MAALGAMPATDWAMTSTWLIESWQAPCRTGRPAARSPGRSLRHLLACVVTGMAVGMAATVAVAVWQAAGERGMSSAGLPSKKPTGLSVEPDRG